MQNIKITFFKNALSKDALDFDTASAIHAIKGDEFLNITSQFRLMDTGKKKDNYKKNYFPAVCWSVSKYKNNHRLAANCLKHSGLICLDIDKLDTDTHQSLLKKLTNDPYTFILFTSPSGNGIKVISKIAEGKKHTEYYSRIEQRFLQEYGISIDPSGKDVSRLCFLCCDNSVYFNPNCNQYVFDFTNSTVSKSIEPTPKEIKLNITQQQQLRKNIGISVNDVFEFTQNICQYQPGNRNNFLYLFACNCNRKGIDPNDCLHFAFSIASDKDEKEVRETIQSAYKHHTHEHAKFAPKNQHYATNSRTTVQKKNNKSVANIPSESTANDITKSGDTINASGINETNIDGDSSNESKDYNIGQFWVENINEKTGKKNISLHYSRFYDFLEKQGYANLKIDNQNVELIHIVDNIVTPVMINNSRNDVKTHMNAYCKKNELSGVLEMLHRGQDKYFARKQFINIGFKQVDFLKDEKDVSYHFHSNCVVEVRAEGLTVRDYAFGEKSLWASQINPRPFIRVPIQTSIQNMNERITAESTNCEFAKYQILASCHPDANVTAEVANKRYLAHATSFGYLINNYKPSIGRAIVGVDHHKAIDRSEQNGRTGKGILSKAIGYVTKRFAVDGRKFDPKDQSVFEGLTMDSKVITVDDCHEKFDFGHFFVPITEDLTVRKMYLGYITIPYDISPKFYFNTNFTFKGDGDSFSGRQHIIEFDNFFNKKYTPIHYFGHSLFRDWSDEEWNLFYNYAYECDCLYKVHDLVEYAEGNYMERKLINECPQEFIDFVDAQDEQTTAWLNVVRDQWFDKKKFLEAWNVETRSLNMHQSSSKQIYAMLKKYCQSKGMGFFTKKSNGTEVYWIGNRIPIPLTSGIKSVVQSLNPIQPSNTEQKEFF